jgi:hypothetical protein
MSPRLTLHIGTPKSGTTYLQTILRSGRRTLRRRGICYPGEWYLPQDGLNQQAAIYALGRRNIGWVSPAARENALRHFDRLCEEVSGHSGRVLISAESLCFFDTEEIQRLLDDFRVAASAVDVVITGRDFGRLLPSIWQQNVKNGTTQPLEHYLDSVSALRGVGTVPLWTAFGLPGLVERWSRVVGLDRVTLVTVPQRGGGSLWSRFASAVDIPETLDRKARGTRTDRNLSLTASQTSLLRYINRCLEENGYPAEERRVMRGRLLDAWMASDSPAGSPIALPERLRPVVERWADEDITTLGSLGVRVVGSLEELRPGSGSSFAPAPDTEPSLDHVAGDVLILLEKPAPVPAAPVIHRVTLSLRVARALRRRLRVLSGDASAKLAAQTAPVAGSEVIDLPAEETPGASAPR